LTDKPLPSGFRPDVAWFKEKRPGARPHFVFEIERGGRGPLSKSIQSLRMARMTEDEMRKLRAIATDDGLSTSDTVRQLVRRAFADRFPERSAKTAKRA
jgi:hypothetical protein